VNAKSILKKGKVSALQHVLREQKGIRGALSLTSAIVGVSGKRQDSVVWPQE